MDVFLELLSCGCCVDIQHYAVYNIVSNAAPLYKRMLHIVHCNFWYGTFHYVWENNIKLDLQDEGFGGMDRVKLAEDKDSWRGPWDCGTEPSSSIKCGVFLSSCKTVRSQEALFCME